MMDPPQKATNAWHLAVEKHIKALPPEYRTAFRSPANAEDCLLLIQDASMRNRGFDKLAILLKPLIDPLKRFEESVDVLIQTYSSVASPVWGPLRAVITILSDRLSTLWTVTNLLQQLMEPLQRFQNFDRIFENDRHLQCTIGALYCDLIDFCSRVVCHSTKSALRRNFRSFDRDVSEISERIRFRWAEVDAAANAANISEAKAAREAEAILRVQQLRKEINRWLSPSNVEDDLCLLYEECMEKSCDWIVQTSEFKSFLQCSKSSNSLRISGLPGGGKSTAAAFLIRHLKNVGGKIVLYFFCKASDSEKAFTLNILRTLTWQLLQCDEALYEAILPVYQRSGRALADSEAEAYGLFNLVVRKKAATSVLVVLDGLDECHDATKLLPLLENENAEPLPLHLILSARDDAALEPLFASCSASIVLNAMSAPLSQYIHHRVDLLDVPLPQESRAEISEKIVRVSDGLWLFARLILDDISEAPTHEEIYKQLDQIPDGLGQLYTSILAKKESKFNRNQMRMSQQLFLWIDTSEYIPACLWQVSFSSLSDDMINVILKSALQSNSSLLRPRDLVKALANPLVHTRILHQSITYYFSDGSSSIDYPHFAAEFFHQTAKQYLTWVDEQAAGGIPKVLQPRKLADLYRGVSAIWYFGESIEFQEALQQLRERPRGGSFECWLEMSSALWRCLMVEKLPMNFQTDLLCEAEALCNRISIFLTTELCLGFIEASVILGFAGQSSRLIDDIEAAYDSSAIHPRDSATKKLPDFLVQMLENRRSLLSHLGHSVVSRWPQNSGINVYSRGVTGDKLAEIKPCTREKFGPVCLDSHKQSQLGRKIDHLAHRYQYLFYPAGARSSNCFLVDVSRA